MREKDADRSPVLFDDSLPTMSEKIFHDRWEATPVGIVVLEHEGTCTLTLSPQ